jgi:hypothetical protein
MSQIEDFKKKAMQDPAVLAELSTLSGKSRDELIAGVRAIAARHGYSLSESEISTAIDQYLEGGKPRDLDEADLEKISAAAIECAGLIGYTTAIGLSI